VLEECFADAVAACFWCDLHPAKNRFMPGLRPRRAIQVHCTDELTV
jgi:hypothetical protein